MAALAVLEDYKIYKKKTKTDDDELITTLLASTSNMVKAYCGHTFIDYYSANKVETFNIAINQDSITLIEWPIVEVVSVEYKTSYDAAWQTYEVTDYFIDSENGIIFKYIGCFPNGFGSVRVTYKGGYSTTPEDIKVAVLDLVTHYMKEEYKERKTNGVQSIDNASSTISTSKWPAHVIRVLDMYRNV